MRSLLRRLLVIPPALLLVNFLGFSYSALAFRLRAEESPYFTPPDTPLDLFPAYWSYFQGLLRLDIGKLPGPAAPALLGEIVEKGRNSAGLLGLALGLSVVVGLILGLRAVRTQPPGVVRWLVPFSTVGLAMPSFLVGGMFISLSVFYLTRGGKPPIPLQGFGWDNHLIFPVLALMLRPTAQVAHTVGTLLSSELNRQYVVAARSLGHSWRRLRWRTALRNVVAPIILMMSSSFRLLVAELIVVEWLFGWPGLGRMLAASLIAGRASAGSGPGGALFLYPPVLATLFTLIAAIFLLADWFATLLVQRFDPRLRNTEAGGGDA